MLTLICVLWAWTRSSSLDRTMWYSPCGRYLPRGGLGVLSPLRISAPTRARARAIRDLFVRHAFPRSSSICLGFLKLNSISLLYAALGVGFNYQ
eukprot:scaffold121254_cov28-Tisochrysis_lutea.AAC.2